MIEDKEIVKVCNVHGKLKKEDIKILKNKYLYCRICERIKNKKYREKNREFIRERTKILYRENKEKFSQRAKKYYSRPDIIEKNKLKYLKNKESGKYDTWRKNYENKNKEYLDNYRKNYRLKNKDKINNYGRIRSEKCRNNLSDSYVRSVIIGNGILRKNDIPESLINLKKEQLRLKRELKKCQ